MEYGEHSYPADFLTVILAVRESVDYSPSDVAEDDPVQLWHFADPTEAKLHRVGERLAQAGALALVIIVTLVELVISLGVQDDG